MSVITSWGATPNRLKIAIRFVASCSTNGVTDDILQQTLLPGELARNQGGDDEPQGGSAIGSEVVSELRYMRMLISSGEGFLKVAPRLKDMSNEQFVQYLKEKLLDPTEAAIHGQEAFPRALSWFLCQDPGTPLAWGYNYRELVEDDCGSGSDSFELRNDANCNQFVYWARFLGFAWRLNLGGRNTVIPDPTKSIARSMGRWGELTDWQPIGGILNKLAIDLPVLEGGTARTEIESKLATAKQRPNGHISRSTSFALRRLERSGLIEMARLSDARAMNLDFSSDLRAVSHVKWTGLYGD